jgi:hypothetical protein
VRLALVSLYLVVSSLCVRVLYVYIFEKKKTGVIVVIYIKYEFKKN